MVRRRLGRGTAVTGVSFEPTFLGQNHLELGHLVVKHVGHLRSLNLHL